ncbi:tryptophan synthase beta subunit-like PLP-dependent enzyme [Scleroderma yunnanense]
MKFFRALSRLFLSNTAGFRQVTYGILIGVALSLASPHFVTYLQARKRVQSRKTVLSRHPVHLKGDKVLDGVTGLIGNTPLVRINSLSNALGVEILGKAEFLNPGGSVKDRVALRSTFTPFQSMLLTCSVLIVIEDAERQGLLRPHTGSRIFEGTVGSTGISMATIARARGYETTIIMPDDVAEEKVKALQCLGAEVQRVRPASIIDKKQFVNMARQAAVDFGCKGIPDRTKKGQIAYEIPTGTPSVVVTTTSLRVHPTGIAIDSQCEDPMTKPQGFFADQFENRSNFDAHYEGTGPEIWRQTNGKIDAFISGAGTGGTIAGAGQYIKSMNKNVVVALADPEGSGLFNKVKYGVMYDRKEAEGTKRRHQVDTVVEGIGSNRMTNNIDLALPIIDDAFRITDAEAVAMSRYLVQNDGLFLGSSSACNLVACVKLVCRTGWKEGQTIITILYLFKLVMLHHDLRYAIRCDSGNRHYSKFWNDRYLQEANIPIDQTIIGQLLNPSDTDMGRM